MITIRLAYEAPAVTVLGHKPREEKHGWGTLQALLLASVLPALELLWACSATVLSRRACEVAPSARNRRPQ